MKRLLSLLPLAVAGCIVVPANQGRPVAYQPPPEIQEAPPPAPTQVWYYGEHFIPDRLGGGWCYDQAAHVHDYYPDQPNTYVVDGGYYYYRGPLVFTYVEGHPLPGGGWCTLRGPHTHDYAPPPIRDFEWRRGRGWAYVGAYHAKRPPPPAYWPVRAAPQQRGIAPRADPYQAGRPLLPQPGGQAAPVQPPRPDSYQPGRPLLPQPVQARPDPHQPSRPMYPQPAAQPGPAPFQPAPADHSPGHSGDAPGHGNVPPGHGGTPPGHAAPAPQPAPQPALQPAPLPAPGRSGDAPGHGNVPPGHGGTPPGHAAPAPAPAPAQPPAAAPAPRDDRRERKDDKDKKNDKKEEKSKDKDSFRDKMFRH